MSGWDRRGPRSGGVTLAWFAAWCAWACGHDDRPLLLELKPVDGRPGETVEGLVVRMSNCPVRRRAYRGLPFDPFRSWVLLGVLVDGQEERPVPLEHVVSIELADVERAA